MRRAPETLWAWGYYDRSDGVKLEMASVGGRWHTTVEALRRFIDAGTRERGEGLLNPLLLTPEDVTQREEAARRDTSRRR